MRKFEITGPPYRSACMGIWSLIIIIIIQYTLTSYSVLSQYLNNKQYNFTLIRSRLKLKNGEHRIIVDNTATNKTLNLAEILKKYKKHAIKDHAWMFLVDMPCMFLVDMPCMTASNVPQVWQFSFCNILSAQTPAHLYLSWFTIWLRDYSDTFNRLTDWASLFLLTVI